MRLPGWCRSAGSKAPVEARIAARAERLRRQGYSAIAALAAAEAIEMGRQCGLRFVRVELEEETYRWWAHYETGRRGRMVRIALPLVHATEAHQRGVGSLN